MEREQTKKQRREWGKEQRRKRGGKGEDKGGRAEGRERGGRGSEGVATLILLEINGFSTMYSSW